MSDNAADAAFTQIRIDLEIGSERSRRSRRYGCDPDILRDLCAYWLYGSDLEAAAAEL